VGRNNPQAIGAEPSSSAGITRAEQRRYLVEPARFTTLKRGGTLTAIRWRPSSTKEATSSTTANRTRCLPSINSDSPNGSEACFSNDLAVIFPETGGGKHGRDRSAALVAAMIGVILFYVLLQLLITTGFSWSGMKREVQLTFDAWKRRFYAFCARVRKEGFTLIELSTVLVIIALIVGGVLAGQSLIGAAALQSQMTQITQSDTAANTFKLKCGYLPGDATPQAAAACGLTPRPGYVGGGDGNGVIEGQSVSLGCGYCIGQGEGPLFWTDLSAVGLIGGSFNTTFVSAGPANPDATGSSIGLYFPTAKIGGGNYVYVWSGGWGIFDNGNFGEGNSDGKNYFGLSAVTNIHWWEATSSPGLTVAQANAIDKKMDDGLPQSGNVTALYMNFAANPSVPAWAAGGGGVGASSSNGPTTAATPGSSTTCYDNGGGSGPQQYSMAQNSGSGVNCALSFQFQ
jgi:prepilin-type N-terminal cleavage/methylation domain-containing protein